MKDPRIITKILFFTLFLDVLGASMLLPLIPSLFTDNASSYFVLGRFDESHWILIAGLITSIYGFMQFLVAPFMGDLSDRFGRKLILCLGVLVLALSNILFSLSVAIGSLALIVLSRVISGCSGATLTVAQAVVAEVVTPEERVRYFGLIGASLSLALIVGPVFSGLIVYFTQNPAIPFLIAGALGILNFIFIIKFLPETNIKERTGAAAFLFLSFLKNIVNAFGLKALKTLYGALLLQRIGFSFFTAFIAIYLSSRFSFNESAIGLFFGVAGIWMVLTQTYIISKLSRHFSEYRLLILSLPLLAVVLFLYSFTEHRMALYILLPFLSLAVAAINASFPSLIVRNAPVESTGVVLGINASLFSFSLGLAPLLGGLFIINTNIGLIFSVGAMLTLIAWLILVRSTAIQR